MEALRDNDFPVLASCGGTASCATCHVFLPETVVEQLGERSEDEAELLEDADHFDEARSRLSCQVKQDESLDGLAVEIAPEED
ncbi:2Fe-2S iron-sulfur cluster-binding protein [Citricoccus parietis]